MRLIFVGPPGSGKGTQAQLLSSRLSLQHICTGDILRETMKLDTPLALQVRPFMINGRLVPDDLVNDIVRDLFRRETRPVEFAFDGYPRTLAQAGSFDEVLRREKLPLSGVIVLRVDDEEIVKRLTGRRSCPVCKTSYHLAIKPPKKPGVCDHDGAALTQRPDDREETVRERLRIYHENTERMIPHYRDQGLVREIVGKGTIEQIYATILQSLKADE